MTDKEKEFVKNVNIDKAKNKTVVCIILTIINLITYIVFLIFGDFDFGIVFEAATFIFICMARNSMSNYNIDSSRRFIILAMIPIGWLLIYDVISILSYISDMLDFAIIGLDFALQELFVVLDLIMLFAINKDLRKADNPEKYKETTDWFYERLDEQDKEEEKIDIK